jgi:hypothetical protein
MRIVDARTGALCTLPLTLGEKGRGRWLEQVEVARQADRAPDGPEAIGFFTIDTPPDRRPPNAPPRHVVLTRPRTGQSGVLLRIDTSGCYTKGSCGSIALLHGQAEELTRGQWAVGDAGRIGDGPDALWHARGPALIRVFLQGGSSKGYGPRYLVVTDELRISFWKPADLVRVLATGEDAGIERVCRAAMEGGELPPDLVEAISTLDAIEAQDARPAQTNHFWMSWSTDATLRQALAGHGISVPVNWNPEDGIAGIRSGTLVPGDRTLVRFGISSGGGKRWSLRDFASRGLEKIADCLYLVASEDWAITATQYRDGEPHTYQVIDARGHASLGAEDVTAWCQPWAGRAEHPNIPAQELMNIRLAVLASQESR